MFNSIFIFFWDIFEYIIGTNSTKKKHIQTLIDTKDINIIEIGCATANVASIFATDRYKYVGIDIDFASIERAKKKFENTNLSFYCLDILKDELPQNAAKLYDYVLISHTVHHLPDDIFYEVLNKSYSLLKQNGKLVILDMIRPLPNESVFKQFYYKSDRGKFIRTEAELESFMKKSLFKNYTMQKYDVYKGIIQIIDFVSVVAIKN